MPSRRPLAAAGLVSLIAGSVIAQDCAPEIVGAMGRYRDFEAVGTTVFTIEGFAGLRAYDASDIDDWQELSSLDITATASLLTAEGSVVCVSLLDETLNGARHVAVVDAIDLTDMSVVARIPAPDRLVAIQLEGGMLYSLSRTALSIYDLSDPASPALRSETPLAVPPMKLEVSGTSVVIVNQNNTAQFYDATDPVSPQPVATISDVRAMSRDADRVALAGDALIRIYGLSDPAAPALLGQFGQIHAEEMWDIGYLDDRLMLSGSPDFDYAPFITTWDVSNPQSPVMLFANADASSLATEATVRLERIGSEVTFATNGPAVGRYLNFGNSLDREAVFEPAWMTRITQQDGLSYTAWSDGSVRIFSASPTDGAAPLGTVDVGPGIDLVGLTDGMLFAIAPVAGTGHTVFSIDVADPAAPAVLDSATIAEPNQVNTTVEAGSLYAVNRIPATSAPHRLYTVRFDASGVFEPSVGATIPAQASYNQIRARDGLVSIVGSSDFNTQQDLRIYDMAQPAAPALVGSLDLPSFRTVPYFEMVGDTLILKPAAENLVRIDISDPTDPAYEAGFIADLHNRGFIGIDAAEQIALFRGPTTLVSLDIRDPANPAVIAESPVPYAQHAGGAVLGRWDGSIFLDARNPETDTDGIIEFALPDCAFQSCPADLTGDGTLNFFDISAYISLYNTADPAADLAPPAGVLNFFDISAYLALYNAGCP